MRGGGVSRGELHTAIIVRQSSSPVLAWVVAESRAQALRTAARAVLAGKRPAMAGNVLASGSPSRHPVHKN